MIQAFWKKLVTGALAGIITGVLVWILSYSLFSEFFFRIEFQTFDWRLRRAVEAPEIPIEEIIIIDIDERSIQKLGSYFHWPRDYWIKLIKYLDGAGVKLVGLDVIFDPNPRHPDEDLAFQKALREAGNVCTAFNFSLAEPDHFRPAMVNEPDNLDYQKFIYEIPEDLFAKLLTQERFEPTYPGFLNASMTSGYVNLFPDPDGVLRRIPLFLRFNEHGYASFAVQLALKAMNISEIEYISNKSNLILKSEDGESEILPIDKFGQMLISYQGGFKSFRYISFYDALMGFVQAEYFKDKIVLVGSSLPGLFDLRTIPLQATFPGVEVNANVIYQLLHSNYIYQMDAVTEFFLILLFSILVALLLIYPRPIGSIALTVLLIIFIFFISLLALEEFSFWLPMVPLMLTLILAFAVTYVYRYLFEEKDKRQIRKIFSHYVSSSVVEVLLKNPEKVKLGGEKKFCTVLFSDIVGFTTIAESMEPAKLVHLLNDFLTSMTSVIFNHKGMLDKYEGDAIMAVFGAPVEIAEAPELACQAALEMQKQLAFLRDYWKKTGRPPIEMRIGINSGDMIVGNMGSESRFDYTVVGDAVNLASRLEGANSMYGSKILIGDQTFDKVQGRFVTRPLDLLRVRGKTKPVRVYELIAKNDDPLTEEVKQMILEYKRGFKEYLLRNWDMGINYFKKAKQLVNADGPTSLYLDRCVEFKHNPPPKDWDGVYSMKEK
jgi:adenylate cyclase